jgi:hypothetical protein
VRFGLIEFDDTFQMRNGVYQINKNSADCVNSSTIFYYSGSNSFTYALDKSFTKIGIAVRSNIVPVLHVDNHFSTSELKLLNKSLTQIRIGIFNGRTSIVDNIIKQCDASSCKNKYEKCNLDFSSPKLIAAIVALAFEKKLYSERIFALDINSEIKVQEINSESLIENVYTHYFEANGSNNSSNKYVVNAEIWLTAMLSKYSKDETNHENIAQAFFHIVSRIIAIEGSPELDYQNNRSYKGYILFDNINDVFRNYGKSQLSLIRLIYEKLNELLSTDPNYMHQRGKCYIRSFLTEDEKALKNKYIDKAIKDINVAKSIVTERHENSKSKNYLRISLDHMKYTMAVALCHKCKFNSFTDKNDISSAIGYIYESVKSPYNPIIRDTINSRNAIEEFVGKVISEKSIRDIISNEELKKVMEISNEISQGSIKFKV